MDGLPSFISTNSETFNKYYKQKYGYKFEKSKIYKFDFKFKNRFYKLDWGISHSCFEHEPFGYGIFEAVDWGKLPILHERWHVPLDYKYKALTRKHLSRPTKRFVTMITKPVKQSLKNLKIG